ncbi:MAG: hypothetical protein HY321_07005 [Armatimonadetes bacterium]|nr:hypothetical protein [Armatimonadota bacterium]
MSILESIRRAMVGECDPLCAHALAREGGAPLSLLANLGLVKLIRQGIPACSEHGCRYRGDCEHEALFKARGEGRSGRKARVTKEGRAAAADPERLRACVRALPLCEFVLRAVAEGPQSVFALNTALVDRCLAEISEKGQVKATAFARAELGRAIALLGEMGLVRASGDQVLLAAPPRQPRAGGKVA